MIISNIWTALIVVGVISCLSTLLAIILYKYSSAVVQSKTMRLSGAIAIAWILFFAISKFYLSVTADIKSQSTQQIADRVAEVELQIKNYKECSLHVGEFKCKVPADRLMHSCENLIAILK
jgi:hypothetical protein